MPQMRDSPVRTSNNLYRLPAGGGFTCLRVPYAFAHEKPEKVGLELVCFEFSA